MLVGKERTRYQLLQQQITCSCGGGVVSRGHKFHVYYTILLPFFKAKVLGIMPKKWEE